MGYSTTSRHVNNPSAKILIWLCAIVTSDILICTLWPFDAFPPNRVFWLQQGNGIVFRQQGVVFSPPQMAEPSNSEGTADSREAPTSTPCSLEVWIKPAQTTAVGTMFNIYVPGNPHRFLLRQYLVGLIINRDVPRPRRTHSNQRGRR